MASLFPAAPPPAHQVVTAFDRRFPWAHRGRDWRVQLVRLGGASPALAAEVERQLSRRTHTKD